MSLCVDASEKSVSERLAFLKMTADSRDETAFASEKRKGQVYFISLGTQATPRFSPRRPRGRGRGAFADPRSTCGPRFYGIVCAKWPYGQLVTTARRSFQKKPRKNPGPREYPKQRRGVSFDELAILHKRKRQSCMGKQCAVPGFGKALHTHLGVQSEGV